MKKILFLLLVVYSGLAFGQINLSEIDKQCFLLGTIDDYMGHQQTMSSGKDSTYYQLVDIYRQSEKDITLLIDSLFKLEYNDLRMTNNGAPKGIRLYSKLLSTKINSFYNYSASHSLTMKKDTIYIGRIKTELISTELEKLSFLAGAFLRDGTITDANEYFFTMPNSTSKAKFCVELLNEFNCSDIKYHVTNRIPVGHWITFKPSEKVLDMFKNIEGMKKEKPYSTSLLNAIISDKY